MLHSRISLLIHSKGNSLHLLTTSSQSIPLPPLSPWQPQVYYPSPWFSFLRRCSFVLDVRFQLCDIIWYLSLSFWLISLSVRFSTSIHVAANGIMYGWVVFHCVYVPHLPNPIICWWIFGLFPCLGYCEQCRNEHAGSCVFFKESFVLICPRVGLLGDMVVLHTDF